MAELRQALQALYGDHLVRIVLFGSQARGDEEQGSDIDALVVLNGAVSPGKEIARTGQITADLSLKYDVVISCTFDSAQHYETEQISFLLYLDTCKKPLHLSDAVTYVAEHQPSPLTERTANDRIFLVSEKHRFPLSFFIQNKQEPGQQLRRRYDDHNNKAEYSYALCKTSFAKKGGVPMDAKDLKKFLAGLGIASLLAGTTLMVDGCKSSSS